MIHKRRGAGLGWNWLALAIGLLGIALVVAGAVHLAVSPIGVARLLVGALVGLVILRKATQRT